MAMISYLVGHKCDIISNMDVIMAQETPICNCIITQEMRLLLCFILTLDDSNPWWRAREQAIRGSHVTDIFYSYPFV